MTRRLCVLSAIVAMCCVSGSLQAYLKLGTSVGNRIVGLHWTKAVHYYVTNRDVAGVTAPQLQTAVAHAFATWSGVSTADIGSTFGGFVNADPFVDDGMTVIGFRARPDLDRTLGATTFVLDTQSGEVLESDIFLNSSFAWSVADNGESARYDVESIATHEIGHLYGLSHSALGETELIENGRRRVIAKASIMFPIAYPSGSTRDRSLQPDDKAGLSDIYGTAAFMRDTGSISGRVLLNGAGIFGAHVVAFNPRTGVMIGTFTLTLDGDFVLAGLEPGLYVIRAEPLDDADTDSFLDGSTVVNVDFKVGYASKLISVPAGGSAGAIQITVQPK